MMQLITISISFLRCLIQLLQIPPLALLRSRLHTTLITQICLVLGTATTSAYAVNPTPVFKRYCEDNLSRTEIEVVLRRTELQYDLNAGIAELTEKSKNRTNFTLGLTEANYRAKANWKNNSFVDRASQAACMRPSIRIELSLDPHIVYVAREFPNKTCAFEHVMRHEYQHVRVNETFLKKAAQVVENMLRQEFGNKVYYGRYDDLRNQLSDVIEKSVLPQAQRQFEESRHEHQLIDNPGEYARNAEACNGDIQKVLRAITR